RIAGDDPATIVWVRMAIAATLLLPWVRAGLRTRSLTLARPQIALVAVSGVLLAGHFLLWTASLQYTSIAASVLLVSLHPVMVSPLGWRMLGERTGARAVGGIGVAIIGTAITCAGDFRLSGEALGGDLLALGGAACLAGYLVIGRGVRYSIGVAPYSAAVYAVVAIVAAVTAVTQRTAHLPSARVAVLCLRSEEHTSELQSPCNLVCRLL